MRSPLKQEQILRISGDRVVNITDLLDMLSNWGPCIGPCPQDTNSDGVVNIVDLLDMLSNWGVCP